MDTLRETVKHIHIHTHRKKHHEIPNMLQRNDSFRLPSDLNKTYFLSFPKQEKQKQNNPAALKKLKKYFWKALYGKHCPVFQQTSKHYHFPTCLSLISVSTSWELRECVATTTRRTGMLILVSLKERGENHSTLGKGSCKPQEKSKLIREGLPENNLKILVYQKSGFIAKPHSLPHLFSGNNHKRGSRAASEMTMGSNLAVCSQRKRLPFLQNLPSEINLG